MSIILQGLLDSSFILDGFGLGGAAVPSLSAATRFSELLPSLFTRSTFMGASVVSFSSQVGWNDQTSQLTLNLVEDPENGDSFNPPSTGTPVFFQFFGSTFFGLFQRWVQRNSPDGLPTYQVTCVDPRGILEGTQVIVRDYNGSTSAVSNLLNAYGFWESTGYGNALVNDAGMPWYLVLQAVEAMTNTVGGTDFGGPLAFRDFAYAVDLSELPVPPPYYRVGASDSLLTMISQVCQDGGCDFFVELEGYTIAVRTVSRYNQPPLGTIAELTNSNWGGTLLSSDDGLESRNEITSSFLVGGEQANIFLADDTSISSFWGFDPLGIPITGLPGQTFWGPVWNSISGPAPTPPPSVISLTPPESPAAQGGSWSWTPLVTGIETMVLNASEVAYILGSTSYQCSTLEMRCAQANQETWEAYIFAQRPDVAAILGIIASPYSFQNIDAVLQNPADLVNDAPAYAKFLDQFVVSDDPLARQTALWQFIRKAAEQYLGRTFLVNIPFVLLKEVPDSLQLVFSEQVVDGGYLPEGSEPLGLADYNEDFFTTEDGRLQGFAVFDTTNPIDLAHVQPTDAVLQTNGVYQKIRVESQIYLNPLPCVVVELPTAVYELATDFIGDSTALGAVLGTDPDQLKNTMQNVAGGSVNLLLPPNVYYPTNIAIPLQSNVLTYGPWYVSGPPGKVVFEFDNSLVPWMFGGYDEMNDAGLARVTNAVTFMQEAETGHLELSGAPMFSLGDVLQDGGPNITNINVSYGANGISTQFDFQTFSTTFGVFSKQNADRMKRLGQTGMQMRRTLRQLGRNLWQFAVTDSVAGAGASFNSMQQGVLKVARPQTPHAGIAMRAFPDANETDGSVRVIGSTMTAEELVRAARADSPDIFQQTALMSLTGLLRPFSTNPAASGLSHYQEPSGYTYPNAMTSFSLNPFASGHDVDWLSWGSDYEGLNTFRNTPDDTNTRALALRAPLLLSGWGLGVDGNAYPGGSGDYTPNVLHRSDLWKTGVLDVLWDDARGVWTCHDALTVIIPAGTTLPGTVNVMDPVSSEDTGVRLQAYNWFNTPISATSDLKAIVNYISTANRWYVVATDC